MKALAPEHIEDLSKSGLSEETISSLQFEAVRPNDIKLGGVNSAFRIPYFTLDGGVNKFERHKLFPPRRTPDGHSQKYHQPPGSAPHLYFPPLLDWVTVAQEAGTTIHIAEGEKKAAKACQEKFNTIGVAGVWCWRNKLDGGEAITIPDLDRFNWSNRSVEIIPDSDAWRPEKIESVLSGFFALGKELERRGARVVLVKLPDSSGRKVGLDDWLCSEPPPLVEGWIRLERIELSDQQLNRLTAWFQKWQSRQNRAAEMSSNPLAARVNAIRLGNGKGFEKKRDIADYAVRDLRASGRLIRTEEDELLYFDATAKTLEPIEGQDFLAALCDKLGLNPTEEETRFVQAEIRNQALVRGERAAVHQFAFWDKAKTLLYVWAGNGSIYTCDGVAIKKIDNGTDGVLFKEDHFFDPVIPDIDCPEESFHDAFKFITIEDASQAGANLAVLKIWVLSVFFLEALKTRPILTIFGEQNSGKSSTARLIGLLLFGKQFEVGGFSTDRSGEADFLTAATNQRLIVYDNADSHVSWLQDHLARAATGAVIHKRKLYDTNTLLSYRFNCFLVLTSRDPKWNRDDVAKRLLPIRLHSLTREGNMTESSLQERVLRTRNKIFGAVLRILNRAIGFMAAEEKRSENNPYRSSHRLADFHQLGTFIAQAMGAESLFECGMENLNQSQLDFLAESDERLDLLRTWIDGFTGGLSEIQMPIREIYIALKDRYPGADRNFPFRSTTALGSWLSKNKELIKSQLGVKVEDDRLKGRRCWTFSSN